jgi:recombination protein RecR
MYPPSIQHLIKTLSRLPGVGNKTAERYAFFLLKSGKGEVRALIHTLETLMARVKTCESCLNFSDQSPCSICADNRRNKKTICIVAESQDVEVFELTKAFSGLYHVLRGTIDPDDEESLRRIPLEALKIRIEAQGGTEVILGLNHDMRGETTAQYVAHELKKAFPNLYITRLARGLAMGSDLQYADQLTLGSAIAHRTAVQD